jgi:hypothetical protein
VRTAAARKPLRPSRVSDSERVTLALALALALALTLNLAEPHP